MYINVCILLLEEAFLRDDCELSLPGKIFDYVKKQQQRFYIPGKTLNSYMGPVAVG